MPGVAGTWKDLTDNVNVMASNLTSQVRGIAKVVTAVANGDLERKTRVSKPRADRGACRHDQRHDRITLRVFAGRSRAASREVGIEGSSAVRLRCRAPPGTWRT